MIKIKRKLILLLCIIFLFNSSVTGRAKETTLQKAFITVGLSDRTTQMYRVILKNSEIYISAKDLAGITGYKYIEDGCIEFEKNRYNLMEKVFIDFSGDAEVSQKKYKLDIIKRKKIYYLPLEKTLYLLRANWCVENDIVYINPMDSDILDFIYLYWDEIETSKLRQEDLFINKEYNGVNNLTDSFWNSLVHMTRDFDNRLYIPGGAVDLVKEEYEKALMQLNEDDQQFLGEEGQKNIEEQLKQSELDTIETKEGILEKFIEIPEKAESLTELLDNYEKENTVARKISNIIKKSEIQKYKMTDLSEMCSKFSNALTIIHAVFNVMEISSWADQMDEEFLNQLSIIEDINDKKIYSGWTLNRMKEAAQDLRKRKENKPESVVYSSWKEIGKSLTGALADLTCTGKLVSAIQMIDSINSLTESDLNKIMKAKELNYSIRYFLNLEQLAEIESVKQYGEIFVDKKLDVQTIQKMRSIILMRLRVDLRARSMLYKLNQMERKDKKAWEKSVEAKNMMKHIQRDYALIIELQSTEKSDKRLPQDSLKNMYCDEDGLVKEKIPQTILKKNLKGKQGKEEQADSSQNSVIGNGILEVTSRERDIVLTLDVSASMDGIPLEETKKAATKFVDSVLDKNSNIGLVSYSDEASKLNDICSNATLLKDNITRLSSWRETNIGAGLTKAYSMLQTGPSQKKILVLMSDGLPTLGKNGEELIKYAQKIKDQGVLIYTLGFFQNTEEYKAEGQYLMEKIASEGCHYEVSSSEDLVFFFEDVAGQIGGQKYIYVKVACPVDVSVTYKGETLSSAENNQNLRTSFGTLSFRENEGKENNKEESSGYSNTYLKEADSKVKILRLKEGTGYNIKINGTGDGEMDYTIGFVNDEGEYNDLRRFEDIDINKDTVIDTVANTSKKTLLNIDEDGDGKYDLKLQAGVNGYGEEVKIDRGIYIILAYAFISALIITIIVRRITI